ncbi:ribonuclease [Variibacter gotjawalensis]|uniref:Ribonuclease n=1 Tax=Variibacter gotjawalensis TaxID=1333996 RepID=A0A0S3Q0U2_9BRAD|nr:MBL fold metallo-hydrolase [Variibacter gotjawalensis]NIK47637.1 metallo-beta-lactamase family protein [Variibacter gotjawalensis]RZS49534.1 metallo-beta-lactamase family protein [Variibacter gotjawalensis]BAT61797.1 ribonuclease [Variibacter gotjawalensis]
MTQPKLHFHGAAQIVTGSCYRLEHAGKQILIDCGMFQGTKSEKELNYRAFPFDPRAISAMLLTHAHIDHAGLIPKLTKAGYAGPIYATAATVDLCAVMLPDSGHIQEVEVQQLNRRNTRRGRDPVEPIYTFADAVAALTQFRPIQYSQWLDVTDAIRARYWNAGHLLGSASVEIELKGAGKDGGPLRLLFSGDLGPDNKLLQHDPEAPAGVDYVICESTYGDRDRIDATEDERRRLLREEVLAAARNQGALLIPSFAVERTQELLVDLNRMIRDKELPPTPIFIDSPLATKASTIFTKHADEIEHGSELTEALHSHNIRFTESVEQSKAIARIRGFHIIIAASGMAEAGRIRHHLKEWLWRANATVLLVGFQAVGTLGRILLDGAKEVRIMGEEINVKARIRTIDLYSGHADGPELANWVKRRAPIRDAVFLTHGEMPAQTGMTARIADQLPAGRILSPALDATFELGVDGPTQISAGAAPPRIEPAAVGRKDSHNDLAELLIDINEQLDKAADERARSVIVRRLRRALGGDDNPLREPAREARREQ